MVMRNYNTPQARVCFFIIQLLLLKSAEFRNRIGVFVKEVCWSSLMNNSNIIMLMVACRRSHTWPTIYAVQNVPVDVVCKDPRLLIKRASYIIIFIVSGAPLSCYSHGFLLCLGFWRDTVVSCLQCQPLYIIFSSVKASSLYYCCFKVSSPFWLSEVSYAEHQRYLKVSTWLKGDVLLYFEFIVPSVPSFMQHWWAMHNYKFCQSIWLLFEAKWILCTCSELLFSTR